MMVASVKSRSVRGASHQPVFMGSCLAISHTCLPCLPSGRISPTCVLCPLSTSLPSHLSYLTTSLPSHLSHLHTSPLSHQQIRHSKITILSLLSLPHFLTEGPQYQNFKASSYSPSREMVLDCCV